MLRFFVFSLSLGLSLVATGIVSAAEPLKASISQVGDAVHLEVLGINEWDYKLQESEKENKKVIELEIPAIDQESQSKLQAWKGSLIEKVRVEPVAGQPKVRISFIGEDTEVESFDYLTDQPGRLILDLFPPPGKKKAAKKPAAAPKKSEPKLASLKEEVQVQRSPASDALTIGDQGIPAVELPSPKSEAKNGIFDGADPEFLRFSMSDDEISEDAVIKSKENVYLPFPMLELKDQHLENLHQNPPQYEVTKKTGEENKFARLLVTLFNKSRYAVFLKTLSWFEKKFPNSEYNEMMAFMHADIRYKLWKASGDAKDYEQAMARYRIALSKFPNSALAERTQLLMGLSSLEVGDPLSTIRYFQKYLKENPGSPSADTMKFAMAKALMQVRKLRDAQQIYEDLAAQSENLDTKKEAAYVLGDVFVKENRYDNAIEAYKAAIEKYPDDWKKFPNAFYNTAESLFWTGRYKESLEKYRDTIRRFPAHPHAGYTMTRIGELLEILGADNKRVLGAYLETHFRYGETSGAGVARIRFLSERMKDMKEKEAADAIREIKEITKKSPLPRIEEFGGIMVADGLWRRKEYAKAVDLLVKHYTENPTSANTDVLTTRIVRYINDDLKDLVDQGYSLEALQLHSKHHERWLAQSKRIDTSYYLAKAFEQSGVPSEAERVYKDTLNKLYAIKGTKHEKERGIFERLPSLDRLNLRLAAINISSGETKSAYKYLKAIEKPEQLSYEEQLERVDLASTLLEEQGDFETAQRYLSDLINTWKAQPDRVAPAYLRNAQLSAKMNQTQDAMRDLTILLNLQKDVGTVDKETHADALQLAADLTKGMGQKEQAITYMTELLDAYDKERPLASTRYELGNLLLETGKLQKAKDTWAKLDKNKEQFWWNLAQEQLGSKRWKEEYDKYVERIPAMAERN